MGSWSCSPRGRPTKGSARTRRQDDKGAEGWHGSVGMKPRATLAIEVRCATCPPVEEMIAAERKFLLPAVTDPTLRYEKTRRVAAGSSVPSEGVQNIRKLFPGVKSYQETEPISLAYLDFTVPSSHPIKTPRRAPQRRMKPKSLQERGYFILRPARCGG